MVAAAPTLTLTPTPTLTLTLTLTLSLTLTLTLTRSPLLGALKAGAPGAGVSWRELFQRHRDAARQQWSDEEEFALLLEVALNPSPNPNPPTPSLTPT